jgi:glycosyltransferase involved in cell wall biosynthesis
MKVLFASYDGLTDPLGQSQILPYLSGLSAKGASIHIVSFEKTERFEKYKSLIDEIVKTNNLKWTPLPYTKRPPVLSTIFDLLHLRNKVKEIVVNEKIEIIHCRSYLAALIGNWAKNKWGAKFIFDMRGFWADERVEGKIWNLKNPVYGFIYSFFKKKEKEFFINCNQIISLTEAGKKEILTWNLNIVEQKITVIPCCVDIDFFDPNKIEKNNRQQIRTELKIDINDSVFIYTGGIGTWYCLDEMMQFFKTYQAVNATSKFVIITTENPALIFSCANRNGVDESLIRVTESARSKMPQYLAAADLALFFILPSYSKTASSPTKQGEMMAMQLPIICNDNVGDTGWVIRQYKAGWVVNNFSANEFQKTTNEIIAHPIAASVDIRKGAEEFYGLKNGIENYWKIYTQLTTKN